MRKGSYICNVKLIQSFYLRNHTYWKLKNGTAAMVVPLFLVTL